MRVQDKFLDKGAILGFSMVVCIGTISQQSNTEWVVNLQNSCTDTPMGVQTIGSICYTAISPQSAVVPLAVNNLSVTNQNASVPASHAFGSRTVNIANEPLFELWFDESGERMVTLFGKENTGYHINETTDITVPVSSWAPAWTNTVPTDLFISVSAQDVLSTNTVPPVPWPCYQPLFLNAEEQ